MQKSFVRDDKKRNYYLITVKGDKRVNLKEFKQKNHTRSLSFASEDDLMDIMKLIPGSVTPLGVLNDSEKKVQVFLDQEFTKEPGMIGVHPNDNTAMRFPLWKSKKCGNIFCNGIQVFSKATPDIHAKHYPPRYRRYHSHGNHPFLTHESNVPYKNSLLIPNCHQFRQSQNQDRHIPSRRCW